MTPFAGLLCSDAARLQLAASAWHAPPAGHALAQDWRAGSACLIQWSHAPGSALQSLRSAASAGWHVVADCRLDDPEPLARQLDYRGPADPGALVRAAFDRWGDAAAQHITGEFALAAWHPARAELLLCRDPVGGYPLYYHQMEDGLVFATDLPLLLRLPFVSRRLDTRTIAAMLSNDTRRPASDTYYEAIKLLPAGHILTHGKGGLVVTRWWRPAAIEIRRSDPETGLRDAVTAAVEERIRDGRKVAVQLSGGLDSSAVACIAARRLKQTGRRLIAFSSVLPPEWRGPETDERAHVEAVLASEGNIDIRWLDLPAQCGPFIASEQGFALLGQPAYSNVGHIERQFAQLGRELGVDVMLSGFGGDFFASWRGRGVIAALLRERQWKRAAAELAALRGAGTGTWPRLLKREILEPLVSRPLAQKLRHRRARPAPALESLAVAHPREQMRFICQPGRMELVLNASVQFFSRGFGVSLRFPLLDRRIVEYMLSVPAGELQRDGETRSLFRRAMKGVLPESIRLRQDKGPAFDPLLAARVAAARQDLQSWSERTKDLTCWQHVDHAGFVRELAAVKPAAREGWRPGMFRHVLQAGLLARFIEWHARNESCAP